MLIDTESPERDESFASSRTRRRGKSDRSTGNSRKSLKLDRAEEGGEPQEPKLSSLDVLLSILQSDLGEIQDFGGEVRFFDHPAGLIVQLVSVRLCKIHRQIHSGETCPHC